jgi:tripartite ATP-independent transporter DctP family solute receptor
MNSEPRKRDSGAISRRVFLGSVGVTVTSLSLSDLLSGRKAFAARTLKWGEQVSESNPNVRAVLDVFKPYVEERTDIKIVMYLNAQLGNNREVIEGVRAGGIDMDTEGAGPLASFIQPLSVYDVPYTWLAVDQLYKVENGPVGAKVRSMIKEKLNMWALGLFNYGWRQLTCNKPIQSPDDMKGLRFRSVPTDINMATYEGWGAKPTPMNFSELYLALKTGGIDGQDNPLPTIDSAKFYEVQKYLILTKHMLPSRWILINNTVWESFPANVKQTFQEAAERAVKYNNDMIAKLEESLVAKFKNSGMEVIQPNLEPFKKTRDYVVNKLFKDKPEAMELLKGIWDVTLK